MDELTPYPFPSRSSLPRDDTSAAFRVGEVERAAACDSLAEHFAAGRLDPAELEDRVARAMAARSQADLRVLFLDLGPRRTVPRATQPPVPEPRPASALRPVLAVVLVLSLLLAGGMLVVLGAVHPGLALAALVGGTATGIAGACATVLVQSGTRRR